MSYIFVFAFLLTVYVLFQNRALNAKAYNQNNKREECKTKTYVTDVTSRRPGVFRMRVMNVW